MGGMTIRPIGRPLHRNYSDLPIIIPDGVANDFGPKPVSVIAGSGGFHAVSLAVPRPKLTIPTNRMEELRSIAKFARIASAN